MKALAATFILFVLIAGHEPSVPIQGKPALADTIVAVVPQAVAIPVPDTIITKIKEEEPSVKTGSVSPLALVEYAKTLIGTPYLYGSTDPKRGFDCSGFITYVFNHFKVKVPRASVEYTDVGNDVNYQVSRPGDLILFTGTDSTIRVVGHMGIIVSNENNKLFFIHSTSGKQYGVTVTELSPYYLSRFVRIARVFPDNSYALAIAKNDIKNFDSNKLKSKTSSTATQKKTSKLVTSKKGDSTKLTKTKSPAKKSTVTKKATSKKTAVTKAGKKTTVTKKSSATKKNSTKTVKKKPTTQNTPVKKKTSKKKTISKTATSK